ncbi:hypothetical protein ZWY2020_038037 [Hordeum vulgare]|nr:hypothetical protein ZWY2020_038037 [Hordeum vulgare]
MTLDPALRRPPVDATAGGGATSATESGAGQSIILSMLSLSPLRGSMCGTPHPHSPFITFKRINMHSLTSLNSNVVPRDIPKPASADELAKNGKKKKSFMSNIFRKKGRSGAGAGTSDKRSPSRRDQDFLFGVCVAVIVFQRTVRRTNNGLAHELANIAKAHGDLVVVDRVLDQQHDVLWKEHDAALMSA